MVCIQSLEAGFSNGGRFQSTNLQLNVGGTLENNGELIGTASADITCDTITGKGAIRSPHIIIRTQTFAFKGVIDCHGKCTIIVGTPFDANMFKRRGGGEFIIVVAGDDWHKNIPMSVYGMCEMEPTAILEIAN